ncbi:M20 family metallopeptidase [Halobacteriales archaeon Cl-PHB]
MSPGRLDLAAFHRQAIDLPSHEDVDAMRAFLLETLADADATPRVDEAGNLLATRGNPAAVDGDAGTHLVLNTHFDTVAPHVPYDRRDSVPGAPDDAVEGTDEHGDPDVVCGRGACDAKGPLAAMVAAFLDAAVGDGAVTLALTYDEETHQTGAGHLADTLSADCYVVGEPTGLDVCTAARGQFEGTITLRGESAHAADPADGANAIRAAAPVLEALDSYDAERGPVPHEVLGEPTLTATMVDGGEAVNQVPAECTITFDRRSVPPERSAEFPDSLAAHLADVVPEGIECSVELVRPDTPFPDAFATDAEAAIVETLQAAGAGQARPFGAATEASHFAPDAPTVVFGPGDLADEYGPVAHADREYVRLSAVRTAAAVLRESIAVTCG